MTVKTLISLLFLFISIAGFCQIPKGYYDTANTKSGLELKNALHKIITNHTVIPYTSSGTDTWDVLKKSDQDTLNKENVILFYTGFSVNAAQEYNNGKGWEREHTWAKSHGKFETDETPGTDLHNLKPIEGSINGSRGNLDFDYGGKRYKTTTGIETDCYYDSDSWEPRNKNKGDVARILFYMAVRYEGDDGNPDLELTDGVNTDVLTTTGKGFHGKLSTLLKWHVSDPVDSFEIRRNNTIYYYQKNRNPFIDHPEFAAKIWNVTYSPEIVSSELRIYPNPASDFITIELNTKSELKGALYSMTGEIISEFSFIGTFRLNVSNVNKGNYILAIISEDKVFYRLVGVD